MSELETLAAQHYQSTLVDVVECNDTLRILRVRPDRGVPAFEPGQYVTLGLGLWEPRVDGVPSEALGEGQAKRLCKRPYSISHAILGQSGALIEASAQDFLELYVTLIDRANEGQLAPGLTPRLWRLSKGARLHVANAVAGDYTLRRVQPGDDVIFCATGTGEAPHNAMIWSLLARGHTGRMISIVGVRHARDLGYVETHRELERRYPNYHYVTLATRDGDAPKRYVQDFIAEGGVQARTGAPLRPEHTHVYLCGNPDMIGIPRVKDDVRRYPEKRGVIEALESLGFQADRKKEKLVGNIHFEEYW